MIMMRKIVSENKNKNKGLNFQMNKNNNNNYNYYNPASNKYFEEFIEF